MFISESDSAKVDSIWMTADTLFSKVIFTRDLIPYKEEEMVPDDQLAAKEAPAALPQEVTDNPANMRAIIVPDKTSDAPDSLKTPGKMKEPEKLIPPRIRKNRC